MGEGAKAVEVGVRPSHRVDGRDLPLTARPSKKRGINLAEGCLVYVGNLMPLRRVRHDTHAHQMWTKHDAFSSLNAVSRLIETWRTRPRQHTKRISRNIDSDAQKAQSATRIRRDGVSQRRSQCTQSASTCLAIRCLYRLCKALISV